MLQETEIKGIAFRINLVSLFRHCDIFCFCPLKLLQNNQEFTGPFHVSRIWDKTHLISNV